MSTRYILVYIYEKKVKNRAFTDFYKLHNFIDRCLLNDIVITGLYRKESDSE